MCVIIMRYEIGYINTITLTSRTVVKGLLMLSALCLHLDMNSAIIQRDNQKEMKKPWVEEANATFRKRVCYSALMLLWCFGTGHA